MADPRIVALLEEAQGINVEANPEGIVSIVDAIVGLLMVDGLACTV